MWQYNPQSLSPRLQSTIQSTTSLRNRFYQPLHFTSQSLLSTTSLHFTSRHNHVYHLTSLHFTKHFYHFTSQSTSLHFTSQSLLSTTSLHFCQPLHFTFTITFTITFINHFPSQNTSIYQFYAVLPIIKLIHHRPYGHIIYYRIYLS